MVFDGANIWVSNSLGSTMTEIRASDGVKLGTFPAGSTPGFITFDGSNIWVTNGSSNMVTEIAVSDGSLFGTFPGGKTATAIAITPTKIWVTNDVSGHSHASSLLLEDGSKADHPPAGSYPHAIFFDAKYTWISNEQSQVVRISGNI